MTMQEIEAYCLAKPGAYLDWPFGPEFAVVKVKAPSQEKGRIFAGAFLLRGEPKVSLNCDASVGILYRSLYPDAVTRGYHCPPVQQPYVNTITLDGTVPDDVLCDMADHAWAVVVGKLPKSFREELEGMANET